MVELPVSSPAHGWIVSSVDFGDLISLDAGDLSHGHEAGERNGQIIAHRQDLAALVLQVVNQLGILPVFTRQHFLNR